MSTKWWVHAFLLIAICAFMARYFFFVADHNAQPWYHMADADAPYTAQTLLFLNDGDGCYLQHPGATIYFLNSIAIRLLAPFSEATRGLLHFSAITSQQNEHLLTTAVSVGRIVALLIVMALAGLQYWLIFSLTRNRFIAFIFTLFIATSQSTLFHYGWIRPESPSLLFFYLAVLLCVSGLFKKPFSLQLFWSMMLLTGLSLGMAVFAKVQIAPLIASLFAGLFILLWIPSGSFRLDNIQPRSITTNLIASALALVIAPYWALSKPAFLTADLVRTMYPDDQRLYGSLPQDFRLPFFVILVLLFGLAVTLMVFRTRFKSGIWAKLFLTSVTLNQITLGLITAAYIVLLPASVSFSGYLSNTNHMIYATLTNITHGSYTSQASVAFKDRLAAISGYNSLWSSVANVNLLFIVGCITFLCLVKLILKTRYRGEYIIPLWLFATGFVMDLASTLRFPFPYSPYGIYSVGLYGLGLAYAAGLEIRSIHRDFRLKSILRALPGLILVALVMWQGGMKVFFIFDSPRGAALQPGYSREDAWRMIKVITPQFLRLADYAGMAQATYASQVDSVRRNAYGFPGGWRGWLQAIGESRRDSPVPITRNGDLQCYLPLPPARRLPDGACRANQNINNWWLLGFDINESHVAPDRQAELKMHWLPPFDVKPVSGNGFYQVGDNDWVQVTNQEGSLIQWSGADMVSMQNLPQAAPPLAVSGNKGEFSFSHEKMAGSDVIRVSPVESNAGESHRVIQFGPRVNDTEAGLTIRPGQVVFVSLWARLSGRPVPEGASLFIQDQTDAYQVTKTLITDTAWQHYAVFREIREGATGIGIGVGWQPESMNDALAIRDWRVFVLDRCRQDRTSACRKSGPPLRLRVHWSAPQFWSKQNMDGWQLLGFDIDESHVASDRRTELKMHWLPPFDVKPVSGEGFYQGEDNDWVQVVSQEGVLVQWSGADVVKMQNLSQVAPPLAISGNRGEFSFSHEKVAGRDVIRVSPAEGSAGGSHRVIQFGPRINDTEAGLTIRPGQVVFVSLWARLSGRPAPLWPAGLFIQDQTDAYQMTKTPIDGTAWQHYAVFREIREGATRIGIGMYWQPETEYESLEIRDWRVFVLDRCRQDRASARQKCGPPLRQ